MVDYRPVISEEKAEEEEEKQGGGEEEEAEKKVKNIKSMLEVSKIVYYPVVSGFHLKFCCCCRCSSATAAF